MLHKPKSNQPLNPIVALAGHPRLDICLASTDTTELILKGANHAGNNE